MPLEEKSFFYLMRVRDKMEAETIQSLLKANGILSTKKHVRHPGSALGVFSSDGSSLGGIDIYVRDKDKEKAQEIVKLDIDDGEEYDEQESSKKESKVHLAFKIVVVILVLGPLFAMLFQTVHLFLIEQGVLSW